MGNKSRLRLASLLGTLWLGLATANATTFLQFQSTYLGGGWFQYQLNVLNDPFFTEADVVGFSVNFTNQIDRGALPTGWTDGSGNANWTTTNSYPLRPYELTFLVRSSETSYRLGLATNLDGAIILVSLWLADFNPLPIISGNIVGFAMMPCLVPCSPAEADGSPTNLVYDLKLLPDITINRLIQNDGEIYGVDFTWTNSSTFVLQGSTNLNAWTNIAYVWSWPPETIWTTNTPLNAYGQFFRVALVANGHTTNLPPLTASLSLTSRSVAKASLPTAMPRVTGCQIAGGNVEVNVATQPGQIVQVQAMDARGTVRQIQPVTATGGSATVSFNPASLPSPVYFQAVAVP